MAEGNKNIRQVIIGDLALQKTITPKGEKDEIAGSAFYCAIAGSVLAHPGSLGLVARVGDDFDLTPFTKRGIDTRGIAVIAGGQTARFLHQENADHTRRFEAEFGVTAQVDTHQYPDDYKMATWVHLSTAEPAKQLLWIDYLRAVMPQAIISADAFEKFARESPQPSLQVMRAVDLFFLNEEECGWLKKADATLVIDKPTILKKGADGAEYIDSDQAVLVRAPKVEVIDTTGAGETLATIYMILKNQGCSIQDALEQAVNMASLEVTDFGVEHLSLLNS